MAPRRQRDPRRDPEVTDLARYRRERAKLERARNQPPEEPFFGSRPKAGVFLILVIAVLAALAWFQAHR